MSTSGNGSYVSFHDMEKNPSLKNRKLLKKFIPTIFTSEGKALQHLAVIFCSDHYLLRLNQEYLNHDTYTDILTFDLSDDPTKVVGELYISTERVRENASLYNIPASRETYRVMFHGILHLCGHFDKTPYEKSVIRLKENHYLKKFDRFVSRETRST